MTKSFEAASKIINNLRQKGGGCLQGSEMHEATIELNKKGKIWIFHAVEVEIRGVEYYGSSADFIYEFNISWKELMSKKETKTFHEIHSTNEKYYKMTYEGNKKLKITENKGKYELILYF